MIKCSEGEHREGEGGRWKERRIIRRSDTQPIMAFLIEGKNYRVKKKSEKKCSEESNWRERKLVR